MMWLPGLMVLGVAVVVGVWWTLKHRGEVASGTDRRSELERRKSELVEALRSLPEGEAPERREKLEAEAVQVMRELDAAPGATEAIEPEVGGRRPMLIGFLLGSASTAVVAMLLFAATDEWSKNRAAPGGVAAGGPMSAQSGGELPPDHPTADATAATSPEVARLQAAVEANPDDLASRRRLAIEMVSSNQLFEAFQQAQAILKVAPDDFDGRMVLGIVRLAMAGADDAAGHFDTAIAQHPDDPAGYLYRGLAEERRGNVDEAIQIWRRGLFVAGGQHADLEKLIAEAELRPAQTTPAATDPPPVQAMTPAASPAVPPPAAPAVASADGFSIHIELAPGAATSGVLFAALRTGAAGPPVLVKRVASPSFPYDLELTVADAMMGGALPDGGVLTLRLDTDGDALTKGPEEPQAVIEVRRGQPARATLGGGS